MAKLTRLLKRLSIGIVALLGIAALAWVFVLPWVMRHRFGARHFPHRESYLTEDALPSHANILFVTAHPDDLEFFAGGTLPILKERGNTIYLAIMTNGGKQKRLSGATSQRVIAQRSREARRAAEVAGLAGVTIFNHRDGFLMVTGQAVREVRELIERERVAGVFAFAQDAGSVRSDDHRQAGLIAMRAVEEVNPRPQVYRFHGRHPNLIVDTTHTFGFKMRLLRQFGELSAWWERPMMRALQEGQGESYGRLIGVKYAEGFQKEHAP